MAQSSIAFHVQDKRCFMSPIPLIVAGSHTHYIKALQIKQFFERLPEGLEEVHEVCEGELRPMGDGTRPQGLQATLLLDHINTAIKKDIV